MAQAKLKNILTVKEAAKVLKKHPGTIRRWIKEKRFPATKLSGKYGLYLITREDLLEFMIQGLMAE
jgi:excisionase family DNA binding protein